MADSRTLNKYKRNEKRISREGGGRGNHFLSHTGTFEGILKLKRKKRKKHLSERIGILGVDNEFEPQSQNVILDDQSCQF